MFLHQLDQVTQLHDEGTVNYSALAEVEHWEPLSYSGFAAR